MGKLQSYSSMDPNKNPLLGLLTGNQQQGSHPFDPNSIAQVPGLMEQIRQNAGTISGIGAPNIPSDESLWNLSSTRMLGAMRPGMASRGFLTSGNAQEMENRSLQDLLTQFTSNQFSRGLQRGEFQRAGAMAGNQSLLEALKAILGQGTTSQTTGLPGLQQFAGTVVGTAAK